MDVANPSNFVRILEIFAGDAAKLKTKMSAVTISDEITAQTMRTVYEKQDYVLDPHGAVGFYALQKYLEENPNENGIFLETAHPVKFDSVREIVGTFGEIPKALEELNSRAKQSVEIKFDYANLKEIILSKI
jgi:threonine synthase